MILQKKIKTISFYQIIGGAIGLIFILYAVLFENITSIYTLVLSCFGILHAFSIFCGIYLLYKDLRKGILLSKISQCLQFINFSILGYGFMFISGFSAGVGIDLSSNFLFRMWFNLSSSELIINRDKDIIKIAINIFAIFIFITLHKIRKQLDIKVLLEERMIDKLSDI